jgi:hypothetical protein
MTALSIPTVTKARLGRRAVRAGGVGAHAAMQANPEVMR